MNPNAKTEEHWELKRGFDRELERYELDEGPAYSFAVGRRSFLGITGAGLLIATGEGCSPSPSAAPGGPAGTVAARLHIGQDGTITVFTSKVEVGQGSRTQITQAAAEELKVSADQIRLVMADSAVVPDDGGTAGSRTTPRTIPAVRKDAAAARAILVKLAAAMWGADPAALEVRDGAVFEPGGKRSVTYAELAKSAEAAEAFRQELPADVKLTAVKQWSVLGSSVSKRNSRDIVTGAHRYPSDVTRPNILYGKVLRPATFGATLASIDLAAAEKMEGVTAVRDGNFAGCAAPTSRLAQQAVEALAGAAKWDSPAAHTSSKELFPYLKRHAVTEGEGRRRPRRRTKGSAETAMAGSKRRLSASYEVAYVQHAPMEPRAAVAEWDNGRLTVWTGTQQPSRVQGQLAEAFRVSRDKVRLIVPDTGGGFGGKHTGEAAVEAARLAKAAKRPVSLRWTRQEELTWAYFRPAGLIEVEAGLDEKNSITAWNFANYNSGASAIEPPYDIPNTQTQFFYCDSPLREGSYRALASTANCFARESFMDELAASAGADPLSFRLAHLSDDRLRAVLEAAAERFRWLERRKNRRRFTGVGLSCGIEKGSYVAACAEVEADRAQGKIKVVEIVQAFECGAIQNPANLRAQVEGSIIMGLGAALTEEIHFENGRITNALLAHYRVPRFKDVPRIETVLLDRPDLPSVGGSETPIIAVAPAIGNAVFDGTGVRLRAMPMRGERLIKS